MVCSLRKYRVVDGWNGRKNFVVAVVHAPGLSQSPRQLRLTRVTLPWSLSLRLTKLCWDVCRRSSNLPNGSWTVPYRRLGRHTRTREIMRDERQA
jgi:hypothetical protein